MYCHSVTSIVIISIFNNIICSNDYDILVYIQVLSDSIDYDILVYIQVLSDSIDYDILVYTSIIR